MPKKKKHLEQLADLSWDDLNQWAGSKIVTRGRSYQRQGRVTGLAITNDDALIAWVKGTEQYAVKVGMGDDGLPDSKCTCPYLFNCKHAVAVALEYLDQVEKNKKIPKTNQTDKRLVILRYTENTQEEDDSDDVSFLPEKAKKEIEDFLQQKTKNQLIDLFLEMAAQHPEMGGELADRQHLSTGKTAALVSKIRKEIKEISSEPGWRNHWDDRGFIPDYSGIVKKLEALLETGCADEVLALGEELMTAGTEQVGQSDDEGETADEIIACIPVIVKALEKSSWDNLDKMVWAIDAVMADEYNLFEALAEYLHRDHPKEEWNKLADRLQKKLKSLPRPKATDRFSSTYHRDELTNWIIVAFENAGRTDEIIPLCESEAKLTHSYVRLVKILVEDRRFEDADRWIHEGIKDLGQKLPGISSQLRTMLMEIRSSQNNWPAVAAMQIDEFIRQPVVQKYTECQKASEKIKAWPQVRDSLMTYLETGALPWTQTNWPLPASGLSVDNDRRQKKFPMIDELINIAIHEKQPEVVLRWYDQRPRQSYGWHGLNEDAIANAVSEYAPERSIAIWKKQVENLIHQVKPSAYESAANYLRKIRKTLSVQQKENEWNNYRKDLRESHIRKRRFIEILDGINGRPILKNKVGIRGNNI